MKPMDQPMPHRPVVPFPTTPDGKYKYTTEDGQPLHFEPMNMPEIGENVFIPKSVTRRLRRLFRRPTPSH